MSYLFELNPEGIFQANAGFVPINYDGALDYD